MESCQPGHRRSDKDSTSGYQTAGLASEDYWAGNGQGGWEPLVLSRVWQEELVAAVQVPLGLTAARRVDALRPRLVAP